MILTRKHAVFGIIIILATVAVALRNSENAPHASRDTSKGVPRVESLQRPRHNIKIKDAASAVVHLVPSDSAKDDKDGALRDDAGMFDSQLNASSLLIDRLRLSKDEDEGLNRLTQDMRASVVIEARKHTVVDTTNTDSESDAYIISPFEAAGSSIRNKYMRELTLLLGEERGKFIIDRFRWRNDFGNFGQNFVKVKFFYENSTLYFSSQEFNGHTSSFEGGGKAEYIHFSKKYGDIFELL